MRRGFTYAGVFLVAMATLMLEVLLTRITSVSAWYHLAFFVISLGMLGMTAGAALVFVFPDVFRREQVPARMAQSALAFALSTPVCIGLTMAVPLSPVTDLMSFFALLEAGGALSMPFILAGITLTLALTRAGLPPSVAYAVDLAGAALGCVCIIPLLGAIDAASAALTASVVAGFAGVLFCVAAARPLRWAVLGLLTLAALNVANAHAVPPPLRPVWVKGIRELPEWFTYLDWNTYSRVTVGQSVMKEPTFWARGRKTPPEVLGGIEQRTVLIDGAAGTVMARLGRSAEDHAYLDWDITAFAHHLRPRGAAAVIGVGGGRDVLEAARVGHHPVVGIEINNLIVGLHTDKMAEFSGLTRLPGVELVTDEARSYMARETRRYSVITMSLIDTWASTGAGAYSLSENGLYTREAWKIFLDHLAPDGVFTVSRWYLTNSPGETARMIALAMETLWSMGVGNPLRHMVVLQTEQIATLVISRQPFSEADIDLVQNEAVRMGFNMILTPRKLPAHPVLRRLMQEQTRAGMWRWTESQDLDLTPPTDTRPFFFSMLKLDLSFLGNLQATQTLVYATIVSVLLTLLTVGWPMLLRRHAFPALARADVLAASAYFALIGLGFMYVEMGLLSRLNVFLGRPTLALAVLLAGMIFFTGVGSLLSSRLSLESRRAATLYPLVPAALIVVAGLLLPRTMLAFEAATTATRIVVSLLLVAPTAIGLGFGFPVGLRLVERMERKTSGASAHDGDGDGDGDSDSDSQGAELGPWLWGINGACGVCASGLALGTSMVLGIHVTLLIGAGCYLVLPLATQRLYRSGS
jgi:MFS family permease